jgi:hypothetical protein
MDPRETSFDVKIAPQLYRLSVLVAVGVAMMAIVTTMDALAGTPFAVRIGAMFLLGLPLTTLQVWPGKLHVGPDGLLVRWLWTKRFIDVRNMSRIELSELGFVVRLHRGGSVGVTTRLGNGTVPSAIGMSREDTVLLVRRIDALLIGHDARMASTHLRPRLERGSRSVAEWMADLRAIGQRAVSMRVADVDTDDLRLAVEGAQVDPDVRVAAAVALSARSDEDRARVRVAARAIGEPRLRAAIEWAAENDDSAVAEALEAA